MRKFITAIVLASSLAVAGCAGSGSPPPSGGGVTIPPIVGDLTVQQIQDAAAKACSFVPTAQTITGIVASFFPGGAPINSIVSSVVNSICSAITKKSIRRGGSRPMVNGVPVEGYFIR